MKTYKFPILGCILQEVGISCLRKTLHFSALSENYLEFVTPLIQIVQGLRFSLRDMRKLAFYCSLVQNKKVLKCADIQDFTQFFSLGSQRGRDSNPRYTFGVYTLSRRAPSTTRTPLCLIVGCKYKDLFMHYAYN